MRKYLSEVDRAYSGLTGAALEERLLELLRDCGETCGRESLAYSSMLGEVGGFYRGQRRLEESEDYFQQCLALLERRFGREDPNYATALNNLAGTHRLMGRYDRAEEEFSACVELYRRTLGEEHVLYASGLNNLSLLCLERGELDRAAELLKKAGDVLEKHPEWVEELATSLCNLGELHRRLGRLEEAEGDLCRALRLYEGELGTRTPHYHAALNTLGLVYRELGRKKAEKRTFRRAAAAAKALYGEEHPEYRAILERIRETEEKR